MQSKGELESQRKRIVENKFLEGVDIKSYLDAKFPPAKGKVYLRNGNAQGKFKEDYYVAVTPEVADRGDGVKKLDHFLGCSRDDAYTAILRYFLQNYPANCTEDNITQQAMTINPRLGNPEEEVYQRSLNITKDNIRHYIQSEDSIKKAIQQKESPDVFNDLSDILLNNEEAKIKILSPFNEGRGHWLTSEIVILKLATTTPTYNYKVNISLHDPLKAAKALDHNYLKLIKEAIEARLTQIHDVKILIEMNVIDSPFKIIRQVETNKTSCGAIVAHEIEQRVNDERLVDVTDDKKAKILRQEMLDVIQPPTKKNINVALSMTVAEDNNTRDGIATLPLTSSSSSSSSLGSQRVIPLASPSSVSSSASPSSSTLAANAPVPGMTPTTHTQTTTTPTAPDNNPERDALVKDLKSSLANRAEAHALHELKVTLAKYPKLFAIIKSENNFDSAIDLLQASLLRSQDKRIGLGFLKRRVSHTLPPDEAVKALTEAMAAINNLAPVIDDKTRAAIEDVIDNKIKHGPFFEQLKQLDRLTKIARKDPLIAFLKKYHPVTEFHQSWIKRRSNPEHLLDSYFQSFKAAQNELIELRSTSNSELANEDRQAFVVSCIKKNPILSVTGASQKVRELNEIIMMLEEKSYEYENLIGSDVEEWETNAGLKYDALLQEAKTLRKGYQAILDGANVVYSQLSHYDNIVANLIPPIELDDSPALVGVKKKLKEWDENEKRLANSDAGVQTSPPPSTDVSQSSLMLSPSTSSSISSTTVSTSTPETLSPGQEIELKALLDRAIEKAKEQLPYHALAKEFLSKVGELSAGRGYGANEVYYVKDENDNEQVVQTQSRIFLPAGVACATDSPHQWILPEKDAPVANKRMHKIDDIIKPESTLHVYHRGDTDWCGSFKVQKIASDYSLAAQTMDQSNSVKMAVQINAMLESFVALNGSKRIVIQGQTEEIICATILACEAFGLSWTVANDKANNYKNYANSDDVKNHLDKYRKDYSESNSSINVQFVTPPGDKSLMESVNALNNMYKKDSRLWASPKTISNESQNQSSHSDLQRPRY